MDDKDIVIIQNTIDYHFDNEDLLQQAFVRRSYSQENGGENNEVLEFIGDKAIDFVVMKTIMKKYGSITKGKDFEEFKTKYDEGKFTEIKKKLVEGKNLARCIDSLGFNKYLIMGRGDQKNNVQEMDSVKEDLFEAIVGAVTIDSEWDFREIEDVVKNMLDINSFLSDKQEEIDYVAEIQEWYQKRYDSLPPYEFHDLRDGYGCSLEIDGDDFYEESRNKGNARKKVARLAYEYLDSCGLLIDLEDEVGEPNIDRAVNQLQELYQKGYIEEPIYNIYESDEAESQDEAWCCEVYLADMEPEYCSYSFASSKKQAKKEAAYNLYLRILNDDLDEDPDDLYYDD